MFNSLMPDELREASALHVKIVEEEWPTYAAQHNIENPWKRDMGRYKFFYENYEKVRGKEIDTWQEKCDYKFEKSKFIIKRLADQGYYSYIKKLINGHDIFGNKKRLQDFFEALLPCMAEEGQCNMFCPKFQEDCSYILN